MNDWAASRRLRSGRFRSGRRVGWRLRSIGGAAGFRGCVRWRRGRRASLVPGADRRLWRRSCALRRSPLTVMASEVSIDLILAANPWRDFLALLHSNPILILPLSDGDALPGAQLEAQVALARAMGGLDDDGGVGIVETRHVEGEMSFAAASDSAEKFPGSWRRLPSR